MRGAHLSLAAADPAAPKRAGQVASKADSSAIALYTVPAPEPRGCLLASASLADASLSAVNREAVAGALGAVERVLLDFFVHADLPRERAAAHARLCATVLYGLSARARLGVEASILNEDAGRFVAFLLQGEGGV